MRHINTDPALPDVELGYEEILGRIMLNSRRLPKGTGLYASNHVMINNERTKKKYIPPLKRVPGMDEVAREHARAMAEDREFFHTNPMILSEVLGGKQCGRRIGRERSQRVEPLANTAQSHDGNRCRSQQYA
jgi:hypothetical protein